jgi:Predicted membrane protein (DUF2231).
VKLGYLIHGLPGHPLHPPLTDATIGIYTLATIGAVTDVLGITDHVGAQAWWFALLAGLITTVPTALTGLADWLQITRGTPLWRTATMHLIAMVSATVFFGLAALLGHDAFMSGNLGAGDLILTLIGFGLLTLGGWLGGAVVFTFGMRVLSLVDEPAARASSPVPQREEIEAEGS